MDCFHVVMDLQEVGGGCGDWMELAQDRERWRALVSTVMNLEVCHLRCVKLIILHVYVCIYTLYNVILR
jgi:hypothetical protein